MSELTRSDSSNRVTIDYGIDEEGVASSNAQSSGERAQTPHKRKPNIELANMNVLEESENTDLMDVVIDGKQNAGDRIGELPFQNENKKFSRVASPSASVSSMSSRSSRESMPNADIRSHRSSSSADRKSASSAPLNPKRRTRRDRSRRVTAVSRHMAVRQLKEGPGSGGRYPHAVHAKRGADFAKVTEDIEEGNYADDENITKRRTPKEVWAYPDETDKSKAPQDYQEVADKYIFVKGSSLLEDFEDPDSRRWRFEQHNTMLMAIIFGVVAISIIVSLLYMGMWSMLYTYEKINSDENTLVPTGYQGTGSSIGSITGKELPMDSVKEQNLLSLLLPISPALQNAASMTPQRRALNWLTYQDTSLPSTRLIRLYILATFYFSTEGEKWDAGSWFDGNWLSQTNECKWSGVKCETKKSAKGDNIVITGIDLRNKNLGGMLPNEIGRLEHLEELRLQSNNINGHIPSGLVKLANLKELYLQDNALTGSFPDNFGGLKSLRHLDVSDNKLEGNIPAALGKCVELDSILLSNNLLSGKFPKELKSLSKLVELRLMNNEISGNLPKGVNEMTSLREFDLSKNKMTGNLPAIGELEKLIDINLSDNNFDGPLPESLGNDASIQSITLSRNNFDGNIPNSYSRLRYLKKLHLDGNELNGEIPLWLGKFKQLRELRLEDNSFLGDMPEQLCRSKLQELTSDCEGNSPKVSCDCCSECFA